MSQHEIKTTTSCYLHKQK